MTRINQLRMQNAKLKTPRGGTRPTTDQGKIKKGASDATTERGPPLGADLGRNFGVYGEPVYAHAQGDFGEL